MLTYGHIIIFRNDCFVVAIHHFVNLIILPNTMMEQKGKGCKVIRTIEAFEHTKIQEVPSYVAITEKNEKQYVQRFK